MMPPAAGNTPGLASLVTVMPLFGVLGTVAGLADLTTLISGTLLDAVTVVVPEPLTGHGGVAQVFGGAVPVARATLVFPPAVTSAAVTV